MVGVPVFAGAENFVDRRILISCEIVIGMIVVERGSCPRHRELTAAIYSLLIQSFLVLFLADHHRVILIVRLWQKLPIDYYVSSLWLLHRSTKVISFKIPQRNSFTLDFFFFLHSISELVCWVVPSWLVVNRFVSFHSKEEAFGLNTLRTNALLLFLLFDLVVWVIFILPQLKRRLPNSNVRLCFICLTLLLSRNLTSFLAACSCNRAIGRIKTILSLSASNSLNRKRSVICWVDLRTDADVFLFHLNFFQRRPFWLLVSLIDYWRLFYLLLRLQVSSISPERHIWSLAHRLHCIYRWSLILSQSICSLKCFRKLFVSSVFYLLLIRVKALHWLSISFSLRLNNFFNIFLITLQVWLPEVLCGICSIILANSFPLFNKLSWLNRSEIT